MLHHRADSTEDHDANDPQTAANCNRQKHGKHRPTGFGFMSASESDAV
jgi:hypothetical protein